ncbi:MAG: phosphate ABC transporter substrate-binding protein PstS [Candidatus Delongbacteria bacterium]|nr:phosphate ABC transporter substrate-binding protein PstS [Candidatus Delongbacteria bacterium]MBN2835495.1 phosphate ABC transporter substrate-binding protein PstS [Candidatus Delongbacteria bacterium]
MKKFLVIAVMTIVAAAMCGVSNITAAGATFPMPFYNNIFKTYTNESKILVTYGGIGSGGGIRSLKDKIVDFGATDAFLNEKKMSDMGSEVLHIPTCLGAVAIAYNLPGSPKLNLDSETISDIFLGNITKWNDKKIAELNKGVTLPSQDITVVYRSDGSGTTHIFSDYLNDADKEWADKMGMGKSLEWKVGIGAKGNPGVAGTISQTPGAIGYIGLEYAMAQNIPFANVKNKAGNFIVPSIESVSLSADAEMPADTRVSLVNTVAKDGYPITSFTWLIFYKEQNYNGRSLDQAKETLKLLEWIIGSDAQKNASKVNFSPLPKKAVETAKKVLKQATYNGKPIL